MILLQIGSAVSLSFFSSCLFLGGLQIGSAVSLSFFSSCLFWGGTAWFCYFFVFFHFFPPVFFLLFPPSICHEIVCASFSLNLVHRDEVQAMEFLRVCSMGGEGGGGDAP